MIEAKLVTQLNKGDKAIFDPIYGIEEVLEITSPSMNLPNGVTCSHMQVTRHDGLSGPRFIVRGMHEPVLVVS